MKAKELDIELSAKQGDANELLQDKITQYVLFFFGGGGADEYYGLYFAG